MTRSANRDCQGNATLFLIFLNFSYPDIIIVFVFTTDWFTITVQPVHTGPCTNRNPVYTVMIIWSRINCTQNNTN